MRTNLIVVACAILAVGCGGSGGGGGSAPPGPPVASIAVAPADLNLATGEARQLQAVVKDSQGGVLLGKTVTWSSEDASKVSVTAGGLARGISPGAARITAAIEGKNASARVVVVEPAGTVARVALNTVSEAVEEGRSVQLTATAYDAFDNIVDGRVVQWTSTDPGIAGVTAAGFVTGLRPGVVSINAKVDGRTASATIHVFASYEFDLLYTGADIEAMDIAYSLDINDPAAVPFPIFGLNRTATHVAPSPDGTRIAFVVHGNFDGTYWQSMIYAADPDGGNASRLTYLPARNVEPSWSPDGTRIAFSSQPFGSAAEIWVMQADGSGLVNLTSDQPDASKRSPAWSPVSIGGAYRIAYALETGGASFVWTMRADGSDKREITTDANFFDSEPAWSPDGGTLVFLRTGSAIYNDLYLVASWGGPARALMPANPLAYGQFGPVWSPDGQLIAFTSKHADGETYQVWTVWADGTRLAQRTFGSHRHSDPAWLVRQ